MNTTDAQFRHVLSLAEENEILRQKEREAIMLMTSLILDKQRVCDILKNRTIEIQQGEITLLLDALFDKNLYRKKKAYTILFRQLGIHECLVGETRSYMLSFFDIDFYQTEHLARGLSHLAGFQLSGFSECHTLVVYPKSGKSSA